MYSCQITGAHSKEGDKLNKITIETRAKTYKHWDREEEMEWFTTGTEIVRELNATRAGVEVWEAMSTEEKAAFVAGFPSTGG
jgi:hypothetical protein